MRLLRLILIGATLALVGGFFWFAATIPSKPANAARAEGIVAMTGGADRIGAAIGLLADGRAKRLLISGVNAETGKDELARLHPSAQKVLDCCVDLDRRALNTAGNAVETRRWVRSNGFGSIIVVTSSWHMPRTLLELDRMLPEVTFVPYPVVVGDAGRGSWWENREVLRLLVTEYVKYVAALVEIRIAPRIAPDQQPASAKAGRA